MYTPNHFRVDDDAQVSAFVDRYPFATLVSALAEGMVATHLPLLLRRGPAGLVLVGHVARANSHWTRMNGDGEAVAVFLGPHAYISPRWYEAGPAVPTWNYAAVHAHGRPRVVPDPAFTDGVVRELVSRYESGPAAWQMNDLPVPFKDKMLSAIVAFEMPIDRIEAKFKLSQNRSEQDRAATITALQEDGSPESVALAALMRSRRPGGGG